MQVRLSRNDHTCAVLKGAHPAEFWCLVFHHQHPHWYPAHVSLRFGEHTSKKKAALFSYGLQTTGGPAVMVWGFIVVGMDSSYRLKSQ